MKLIRLYVENFGGLSGYTLQFEKGITSVVAPNGFGKTTLAEFIRAMFYGFPRKSKNLDRSLRQKYAPWNGGQYGGYLEFEYEGRCYRIERTFGTNPKADTFSAIDLTANRKTNRFTEELGQELFGLDADSFERSTYLPQQRSEAPLATVSIQAKLSNLVEDSADVGNYDKALAALKERRSAFVPYRGNGGIVAETTAQLTGLQLQLEELLIQETHLQLQLEAVQKAQQDLETIKQRQVQLEEAIETASRQETINVLQQQYHQLQQRHRKVSERLIFYRKTYPSELPSEQQLRRAETAAQQLAQAETVAPYPSQTQIDNCRKLCGEYTQAKSECDLLQQRMEEIRQRRNLPVLLAIWISGAAGFGAGAVFLLQRAVEYACIAFGVGVAALTAGIILWSLRSRNERMQQERTDTAREAAEKYRSRMKSFFASYDIDVQLLGCAAALTQLEQRSQHGAQKQAQLASAREQLQAFLKTCGYSETQEVAVYLQQVREDAKGLQVAQSLLLELEEQLAAMEETYGEHLFAEAVSAADLQQLRREEQQLHTVRKETVSRLLQTQQNVQLLRQQTVKIPQIREDLQACREKLAKAQADVQILDAAIDFLQQARENLSTAYMETIRSRFGYYLAMLGCGDEKYLVDSDLRIQLERQGQARSISYFSAGQTDLVMLCMRLSLVDALFRNQKMFVVLDDPFVNLDDTHMEQARELLHALASDRQILYLTCHSGRTV